jgi:hypothetical protein
VIATNAPNFSALEPYNHLERRTNEGVVATVFLDWGLAFGSGVVFGAVADHSLDEGSNPLSARAFRWGLAYLHIGVIAISVALYVLNGDWMWMYWVDASALPVAVVAMAFAMYEVAFVAGFAIGAALARWKRTVVWTLAATLFGLLTAAEATARVRLFHFGTFAEFHSGRASLGIDVSPFHATAEMWIVIVSGVLSTAAFVLLVAPLSRRSQREQERKIPALAS